MNLTLENFMEKKILLKSKTKSVGKFEFFELSQKKKNPKRIIRISRKNFPNIPHYNSSKPILFYLFISIFSSYIFFSLHKMVLFLLRRGQKKLIASIFMYALMWCNERRVPNKRTCQPSIATHSTHTHEARVRWAIICLWIEVHGAELDLHLFL